MTAISQERPLPQPQSKAPPTVQSSHPDIVATKSTSSSRAPSRPRATKPRQDVAPVDFTSRSATSSLIRRILMTDVSPSSDPRASPKPIEGTLPPLTSSNEIDLQLYAVVAIIVKDFVNTWYPKITPDHIFVEEIVQIIAHCSRALEERVRHIDVAEVLLDELPVLLERHVVAYRTSISSLAQQSYGVQSETTYHSLNPHPALEPVPSVETTHMSTEQSQNEAAYRQLLVNGALAILLPTEDVRNAPLRILVCDIIADLIIGQAVAGKVCEGWFIHDAIVKAIAATKERIQPKASGQELRHKTETRLEKFGLLNTDHTIDTSNQFLDQSKMVEWFWRIMQWMYLIIVAVWSIMHGIFMARHLPKRIRPVSSSSGSVKFSSSASSIVHEYDQSPRPVLAYRFSNFVSTLLQLHDRMAWLGSTFMFWQQLLLFSRSPLAATNSVFDRFLYDILTSVVFTPKTVANVLIGLRIGVFPNNSLGPPAPPPPSAEERLKIRRQAADSILSVIPPLVAHQYFNSDDDDNIIQQIEEGILDVFGNKYMNKHLVYGILELILVRLLPELQELRVGELFAERGVSWGEKDVEDGHKSIKVFYNNEKDTDAVTVTGLGIK